MSENKWVCYLIQPINQTGGRGRKTYIGASNNASKRLTAHNRVDGDRKRIGAKATAGKQWEHVIIVSGFDNKIEALSFEWHWKYVRKMRKKGKGYLTSNNQCGLSIPCKGRIVDLCCLLSTHTVVDNKFKRTTAGESRHLTITAHMPIPEMNWPAHVDIIQQ